MKRPSFSRIGFILAASGSAVGLGNIWRFPYLAGENGGAIFVIIYLLCIAALCFPVLLAEITLGRKVRTDVVSGFEKFGGKPWRAVGWLGASVALLILSFYVVISGWVLGFFVEISFGNGLTDFSQDGFKSFINSPFKIFSYTIIIIALTILIVSGGVVKVIERANRLMMPALMIILVLLIFYAVTLPRAIEGISFYLIPDLRNFKIESVFSALKQSFFSLSLGTGTLMTFGSYMDKRENITTAAVSIVLADTAVALLAGLVIFPLVFSQNLSPAQGPTLAFLALPKAFFSLGPILGRVIGGSFFLLLCFASLTSTISLLEVPVTYLTDRMNMSRKKAAFLLGLIIFILSIPSILSQGIFLPFQHLPFYRNHDFITFVGDVCDIGLVVWSIFLCFYITRHVTIANFNQELFEQRPNSGIKARYVAICISYLCPLILITMTVLIILEKFFQVGF